MVEDFEHLEIGPGSGFLQGGPPRFQKSTLPATREKAQRFQPLEIIQHLLEVPIQNASRAS
jgi:hypothetical protein